MFSVSLSFCSSNVSFVSSCLALLSVCFRFLSSQNSTHMTHNIPFSRHNTYHTPIFLLHNTTHITHNIPFSQYNTYHTDIAFSPLVRSRRITLDPTLTFKQHISNICKTAYFEFRRISSVRDFFSVDATKTKKHTHKNPLVYSFVLSRLDYYSSLLAGCPKYLLRKLQKIQNNTARVVSLQDTQA